MLHSLPLALPADTYVPNQNHLSNTGKLTLSFQIN